jgi:hypothetical protein
MPRTPPPNGPEGTVWFGGEVERARVWLRVLGDELDPSHISTLLGRAPTRARRKGDSVILRSGHTRIARSGSWIVDFDPSPEVTVDEAISALLSTMTDDELIWRQITSAFKVDLVCDMFVRGANQGLVISPSVVQQIAKRNLTFGVDIFSQADDEQARALRERLGDVD